ncbi:unnamed protein product [Calypogeia fissa]
MAASVSPDDRPAAGGVTTSTTTTMAVSVPLEMRRNYRLLRELDIRLVDLQKHMEKQCGRAVQDVTLALDGTSTDASIREHSNRIASVQKECLRIAEDKLALAVQSYELVDSHIQQLDADYRKYEEERKRERDVPGAGALGYPEGRPQEVGKGSKLGGQRKGLCKSFVDELNEPTYCYCNDVSYGDMIACDHPECKLEWFHFDCVGIKERPKGKWFCLECSNSKRRRGK